jgi:hypothetical protein
MLFFRFFPKLPLRPALSRLLTSPSAPATANSHVVRDSFEQIFAPAETSTQHKLVKEAIKKMMNVHPEDAKPIQDEELEKRFMNFKLLHQEAECCIADLREARENLEEEVQCANGAVENCFNAFIDLLEDLRRADENQLSTYNDIRLQNAMSLRKLRQELDMIMQNSDTDIYEV